MTRQMQHSVKSARVGTFGTLRECEGVSQSSCRKTDGFLEGADTYKTSRVRGESGTMLQAEASTGAERPGASGNLTAKEARALWGAGEGTVFHMLIHGLCVPICTASL